MMRIGLAALAGAVILFAWGFVSWVVLPWHHIQALPGEDSVIRSLSNSSLETGVYQFPYAADMSLPEEAMARQVAKHQAGPIGMIVYRTEGQDPMPVTMHIVGFALNFATALAAAMMLGMAAGSLGGYLGRVLFVMLLGVFVATGVTMIYWNYMFFPLDYSLQVAADNVVAALLLGLVLAAIIKQPSYREAAVGAGT